MSQKRGSDKNSVTAAVDAFAGAMASVPVPQGVELESEDERTIWGQFTRARAREDWRDMDLILLSKVVKMEVEVRDYKAQLKSTGVMIENKRGTMVVNPLVSVIDTLERRQLAVIRSMSLNQMAADPRTLNGKAKNVTKAADALDDISALIATPQ